MTTEPSDDDVGKAVVTDEGQEIGTLAEVGDNHIYVDFSGYSGTEHDEDIDISEIKEVTDDQIVVYEPERH